eukprot:1390823-Amorphochlora_amoeboformis.AAC.1
MLPVVSPHQLLDSDCHTWIFNTTTGHGPLHLACLNRNLNVVMYLVETCKLDIRAVSKLGKIEFLSLDFPADWMTFHLIGKTALSIARDVGREDVVSYIEGAIIKGIK